MRLVLISLMGLALAACGARSDLDSEHGDASVGTSAEPMGGGGNASTGSSGGSANGTATGSSTSMSSSSSGGGNFATSCRELYDTGVATSDGEYSILIGGIPTDVLCLMSVDGGGWTLVGNFPWPGNTAGINGWTSGERVGSGFTDIAKPFKLSDTEINSLRTFGFRARGTATECVTGPCSVDTLLFWQATCEYSSNSNSQACSTAFETSSFTNPVSAAPCSWHYGLVASDCINYGAIGTSHDGNHVFAGHLDDNVHAFDGRPSENPHVQFWVR